VGRPPRIDPARIVKAAIAIGLSRVTVKAVAQRLGVTAPALYRHVRSRDEIVKLAAIELAVKRPQADGSARHWSDVVRGCATGMVDLFLAEPQLVCEVMNGTLGPDGEMDFVEQFLAAMQPHGFAPVEAVRIHHAVAILAIGAAVSATAMRSGYAGHRSHEQSIRQALARRKRGRVIAGRPGHQRAVAARDDLMAGFAQRVGQARRQRRSTVVDRVPAHLGEQVERGRRRGGRREVL
jgi:AcrR family transcriptional regulator